jgi:hypothetical protein
MNFDLMSLAAGAATAVVGFVGGVIQQRTSRETRFEDRIDKRLAELEGEVAECRKRDGEVVILRMGMRMIVPEMQRRDPGNPVLTQVANALSALPEGGDDDMADLLEKLNQVPSMSERTEGKDNG